MSLYLESLVVKYVFMAFILTPVFPGVLLYYCIIVFCSRDTHHVQYLILILDILNHLCKSVHCVT